MKLIVLAMLICLVFGTTFTPPTECFNHKLKFMYSIDQVILGYSNYKTDAYNLGNDFLYEFNHAPKVATKEDLGVCSQFEGHLSCCNKNITRFFDYLAAQSVQPIIYEQSPIIKLTIMVTSALNTTSCRSQNSFLKQDEIRTNPLLTKLNALEKSVNQTKIAFAKTLAKSNRGALCSLCMAYDKVNDYLVDGLLSVKQSNIDSYLADQVAAFNIFVATSENQTKVNEVVDEIIDAYTGAGTTCVKADIDTLKAGVKKTYFENKSSLKYSDNSLKCTGKSLYTQNNGCNGLMSGNYKIQVYNPDINPSGRFLQWITHTDDVVVSSTGGIDFYLDGEADSYITDGNFNIPFAEKFPRNIEQTNEYFSDVSSSTSIMAISLFALICVFFV